MKALVSRQTPVLVQGITGHEGSYHTRQMIHYGTNIVGGVTPGKGGEWVAGKPVFDTMSAGIDATGATASIVFVPAPRAIDAIYEAVDAGIELVVCITEGIPILDSIKVIDYARSHRVTIIGPNCPGILVPGEVKLGIIPDHIATPGNIGVVSKSGTLTYEVISALSRAGYGQSMCIGIGGDPVVGMTLVEALEWFEEDPNTDRVALLGEIGGRAEIEAADYIRGHMTKPVIAFVAGRTAPEGTRMGHAGAIIEGREGTAEYKIEALQAAGVRIARNPEDIPFLV